MKHACRTSASSHLQVSFIDWIPRDAPGPSHLAAASRSPAVLLTEWFKGGNKGLSAKQAAGVGLAICSTSAVTKGIISEHREAVQTDVPHVGGGRNI